MKKALSLFLIGILLVCFTTVFVSANEAQNDTVTAADVMTYAGIAARVKGDYPGIRSIYNIDKDAVAELEAKGYTVAYGAIMAIGEKDGVIQKDGDVDRSAATLAVTKTDGGYVAVNGQASAVTVYETGNPAYATGVYVSDTAKSASFAFTTVYAKESSQNKTKYEYGLCYAGFVALTKDGETTYTYVCAEGDLFGKEDATYGVHATVAEVSEYFINDYRASETDEKSIFAENAVLRRTVATVGIAVSIDDMTARGTATMLDATDTTDKTFVVNNTGAANGLKLLVDNAKAGFYKILLRATNNAKTTSEVRFNVNGRVYAQRFVEGETAASANYAVAKDDGLRDHSFYLMLDEGHNDIIMYIDGGTVQTPFGVAGASLVMVEEIEARDVLLAGYEDLNIEATTATGASIEKYEFGTFGGVSTSCTPFIRTGSFVYNVHIPADGMYSLSALLVASGATVNVKFVRDGETVAENTVAVDLHHGGSRAVQYCNTLGSFALPAGDYEMYIGRNGMMAMSNILLSPVEALAVEFPTTTFDVAAKDLVTENDVATAGSTAGLLQDGYTVYLPQGDSLKFTLNVEVPGIYRLSAKHNTAGGMVHYFNMTSSKQTAHCLYARVNSTGKVTAFSSVEEFAVADKTTLFTDADAIGFMYLPAGEQTLTVKLTGSSGIKSIGLGNIRLSLETEQTDGSIYISSKDASANLHGYSWNTSYDNAVKTIQVNGATISYNFTPTVSGEFELFSQLVARNNNTVAAKVYKADDTSKTAVFETSVQPNGADTPFGPNDLYCFGSSASPIETKFDGAATLEKDVTYTLEITITGSGAPLLSFTDFRLVRVIKPFVPDDYEVLDVPFENGAILADGTVDANAKDFYVSAPIMVEKAGTVIRFVTNGTLSGYAGSGYLVAAAQEIATNGLAFKASADINMNGVGYATKNGAHASAGYVTYTVVTTEDNTILRLSAKANEKPCLMVSYVGDAGSVSLFDMDSVDTTLTLSDVKATFGSDFKVTATLSGGPSATAVALAYDKAEYLVGVATVEKDAFYDEIEFSFDELLGTPTEVRVLLVNNMNSLTQMSDTYRVTADGTTVIGIEDFRVNADYLKNLSTVQNAFVVYPDEITAKGANVVTLEDGTNIVSNGSNGAIYYTVNAPASGFYKVDMKYNNMDGYIQYFYVYNTSYSEWNAKNHRGESRIGTAGKATTATSNDDYAVGASAIYGAFDESEDCYVYLVAGQNKLKISMFIENATLAASNKIGIHTMRFSCVYEQSEDTVVFSTPSATQNSVTGKTDVVAANSSYNSNGWFFRSPSTIYFNVTVPEDGEYTVTMFGAVATATIEMTTLSETSLPISIHLNKLNTHSTSTLPITLGKLNLTKGTHTLSFKVNGTYAHANMFMFDKTGAYDANATFEATRDTFDIMQDGSFEIAHRLVGKAPGTGGLLTEKLTVSGKDANGEFTETLVHARTEYDTTYSFVGTAREGLEYATYTYAIYDGDTCLFTAEPYYYDYYTEIFEGLTMVTIGDSYFDDPAVSPNMWVEQLQRKYDMTLYNHGYSGSTASNYSGLIQNTGHGDYGKVSALRPMVDRFNPGAPKEMPTCDPDIVLFDSGRNDFAREVPLGELYNADGSLNMNTETYYGALNAIFAKLKEWYPNALIIGVTCYNHAETNPITGHTQVEFGEAMIAVCEANGVPCFNNLDEEFTGIRMDDSAFKAEYCKSPTDFSHLNAKGMERVLPVWEKFLETEYRAYLTKNASFSQVSLDGDTAKATVIGGGTGEVLALAYDSADNLIGVQKETKTADSESFVFDFSELSTDVSSVRLLFVADSETYTNIIAPVSVSARGVKKLPKDGFTVDADYLSNITAEGNENAYVVYPEEMTAAGNTVTLPNGAKLLPSGTSSYITFKVNAPTAGVYKVDMKYEECDGYIQYFYLYNQTYTAWGQCRGETRFGDYAKANPSTAETDADYMLDDSVRYGAFDGTTELYVYLLAGANTLKMYMKTNVSGNKFGVDAICFSLDRETESDTVVLPVQGLKTPSSGYTNYLGGSDSSVSNISGNNGWFLRGSNTVYFDVTVPESGRYELVILGCAWETQCKIESPSGDFLPINEWIDKLLMHSHSLMPVSLGTLNLPQGTHTLSMSVSGGYTGVASVILYRTGEYDPDYTYMALKDTVNVDTETGAFSVAYNVVGKAPSGGMMTEKLLVTVTTEEDGTVSYTMKNDRDSYNTTHVFTDTGVTGLVDITLRYQLWDGETLMYEGEPVTYTPGNALKVVFLSDLHYAGTNADIDLYSSSKGVINQTTAIKKYASDYQQTDNYGWDSERRSQRIVDELVRMKEAGELDLVFILGDAANNESNYDNYMNLHVKYGSNPLGSSLADFWESPANYQYWLKEMFLDQLSDAGIPYFIANGNHDYVYEPNRSGTDLDYTAWERMFHTAELFGHRTSENNGEYLRDLDTDEYINYEDSDSVHYLVRVIRRNGAVKLVSSLSTEELQAFKVKYADDGNCYDFYVSEDSLTDEDELLAAFMMTNGFRWESYKFYYEKHVYKDENGNTIYTGQTIRYSEPRFDLMDAMMEYAAEYPNVYLLGHLLENKHTLSYVKKYENIKGVFTGDVHNEDRTVIYDGVCNFVDGHNVTAFHYDYYFNADGTKDLQYFNNRGANALTNSFWSDFLRHPYGYITLDVAGSISIVDRVKTSGFYENGTMGVTGGSLTTNEIRYTRATADPAKFEAGEVLYVTVQNGVSLLLRENELSAYGLTKDSAGVREVYVGCDTAEEGKIYRYMHSSYTVGKYNEIDYLLEVATGKVYSVGGVYLGTATALEGSFNVEGKTVSYEGTTYYLGGLIGEVFGHYLYDEKGDYVFVDQNGNHVFIEAQLIREGYVEASIQEQFSSHMYNGPYERFWYYHTSSGEFVSLDKDGDGILDDGIYTDLYISESYKDWHYVGHLFEEGDGPKIVIENGKIVSGEAWARFGYVRNYTLADGTAVSEADLVIDYDANGNIVYGFYQPTFRYANATIFRG